LPFSASLSLGSDMEKASDEGEKEACGQIGIMKPSPYPVSLFPFIPIKTLSSSSSASLSRAGEGCSLGSLDWH